MSAAQAFAPRFRVSVQLLCWEAAFAFAYDTALGPTYLSGLAGELGIGVGIVSILAALPWIGTAGQLVGAVALERVSSVKRYTLVLAVAARTMAALPLLLALAWGYETWKHGAPFPRERWFLTVALIATATALTNSAGSVGWLSWIRDLIPTGFSARFFGLRQRYLMFALIVTNLSAAALIGWKPQGYYAGYAVMALLALGCAVVSTLLLSKVRPDTPSSEAREPRPLARVFFEPLGDEAFVRVLVFSAGFNGAIQLAGSYFPYYFTKELGIPMSYVAVCVTLTNVGAFLASRQWGQRLDGLGDPRRIVWITAHLIALSPLPYLFRSAAIIKGIAPVEYFANGIVWSGFMLSTTRLLFETIPKERNAAHFALFYGANGLVGFAATLLGGHLSEWLLPWGGFRALWVVASACRLGVLWTLFRLLREPGRAATTQIAATAS